MYAVYVLRSMKDGRTYVGCTKDLNNRLKEHNAGEVTSTKTRLPFIVWYKEEFTRDMFLDWAKEQLDKLNSFQEIEITALDSSDKNYKSISYPPIIK